MQKYLAAAHALLYRRLRLKVLGSFSRSAISRFLGLLMTYASLLALPASANSSTVAEVLMLCYFYNAAGLVVNLGKDWDLKVNNNIDFSGLGLRRHLLVVFACSSVIVAGLCVALLFAEPTNVFYSAFNFSQNPYALLLTLLALTLSGWSKLAISFCQRASKSSVNFLLDAYPIMIVTIGIVLLRELGYVMHGAQALVAAAYCSQLIVAFIVAKRYTTAKRLVESPSASPLKRSSKYAYASLSLSTVAVGLVINIAPSLFLGPKAYNYWSYALRLSFVISLLPSIIYNQMPFNIHKQGVLWGEVLNSIRRRSLVCSTFSLIPVLIVALPFLQLVLSPSGGISLSVKLILGVYLVILSEFANVALGPNDFVLAFYGQENRVFQFRVLSLFVYMAIALLIASFADAVFLVLALATVGQALTFNLLCMVESKKYLPYDKVESG
jgi:hypothetical protein